MARPPKPTTPQIEPQLDHEAIGNAVAARDQLAVIDQQAAANTMELAKFLGYDGPLQPELLEHGIQQQMRRTVDACLETGRMLLLLKERVGHGLFLERIEHIGLAPRAAQKFMQSALKFANAPISAHLVKAIGTQNKLLELLVLDDEEIKELAREGSARGIALDEIACMGVMELRNALREAREEAAAKDRLLDDKNKKIDKLTAGKRFKPGPDDIARTAEEQALLAELAERTLGAEAVLTALAIVVSKAEGSDAKAIRGRAAQAMQYMCQRLADIVDEHGIEVSLSEHLAQRPAWLNPLGADDAAAAAPNGSGKRQH